MTEHLITLARTALAYQDRGDPARDVMDEHEMLDALRLLLARLAEAERLLLEAAEWLKPACGDRELLSLYGRIRRAVGTPTSET
jgi:hypothetical protein